ncbi:MAG: BTAD domain-containing putative transcriptional regulator [Chloroflexi bacterium OHK40]
MTQRFAQKLTVPVATTPLVDRVALVGTLERAIQSKRVVTLVAPAGWGKTMALLQWAAQTTLPVCWYTLDGADRDPRLFLDYLLHALTSVLPEAGNLAARLATAAPGALPELYQATAHALATAPAPFALVLDDLHLLEASATDTLPGTGLILELLAATAAYAEPCHLVLASRTLPSFHGLARLAVQQRALMLDYTALQFDGADVQRLGFLTQGVLLPQDSAEAIARRFDGWIVGIALMLRRAAESPDQPAVWQPEGLDQVYAFFAEQTLALLPAPLQQFLEDTSVLEDLSPQRCNTLRERSDAAQLLEEARRHGLFVSRRAGWLSCHSLFRDFLRARLRADPPRERALLERAARIYHDEGDLERAVDCLLDAELPARAVELLREAIPRFRQRSRQTTLLACFDRLQAHAGRRPGTALLPADLYIAQARIYADLGIWDRADATLQVAATLGTATTRWEAELYTAEFRCLQDDPGQAWQILARIPVAALPPRLRLLYHFTCGRARIQAGAQDEAMAAFERAHELALRDGETGHDPELLATLYDLLGWAYAVQGRWSEGVEHLRRADAFWQVSGHSGRRSLTLNNLGMFAINEGRYHDARAAFTTGLALAQEAGRPREEALLLCSLGELETLQGAFDRALERFTAARTLASRISTPSIIGAAAVGGLWVAALQGDSAGAQGWRALIPSDTPLEPATAGRLALAECLLLSAAGPLSAHTITERTVGLEVAVLSLPERAFLALLHAAAALEQHGWGAATASWREFARLAHQVADPLLHAFARPYRYVLEAANGSPLALDLLAQLSRGQQQRWRITALGAFSCEVDGSPCELSPLHRALLVRLLEAGPQGLPVDRLWESVWGDSELSMAALHQALRRLRIFSGLAISIREGTCAITSPWEQIDYDVRALELVLAGPPTLDLARQASALYRGPFLPGAPPGAALWADGRRTQLEQRYLDTLEQVAMSLEQAAPHQAIASYQQILQIDPCREYTAGRLMRLGARFGNHTLIVSTFEHLRAALRTIDAEPAPDTTALFRQLAPSLSS